MKRVRTILLSLGLLAGCNSPDGAGTSPCASATIDSCLNDQQACIADTAGEHCVPCADGLFANHEGGCEAISGTPVTHDFAMFTTTAGQEILGLCQSWTLGNAEEIWVNTVELRQDVAEHHSNWTFVPDNMYDGPDGVWNCDDRNYSQLTAAVSGGVLYAQSTQASHEVQHFARGAAVRIPPYSKIIGDVHVLNATGHSITGHSKLTFYRLSPGDVKVKLVPFHMTYDGLDIPAQSSSRFTGSCALGDAFKTAAGTPFQMKLYYALPHTHKLATRFFFEVLGGPDDGKSLVDISAYNGEPRGRDYEPFVDLTGATGLRFGCEYLNPRPVNVKWGFGDQEMCEMLGFADSEIAFESSIETAVPDGTDNGMQLFTGPCSTIAFKFSNDKPGGPGPK